MNDARCSVWHMVLLALLTWGAVLVARQTADLGHHLHQGLDILHDGALQLHAQAKAESNYHRQISKHILHS